MPLKPFQSVVVARIGTQAGVLCEQPNMETISVNGEGWTPISATL